MFDPKVVDLSRECLIGAVLAPSGEDDLRLVATALARDLLDTYCADAHALLGMAARDATAALDASDLSSAGFATALSRLALLEEHVGRALPVPRAGRTLTRP